MSGATPHGAQRSLGVTKTTGVSLSGELGAVTARREAAKLPPNAPAPRPGCTLRLYADACDTHGGGCFSDMHGALDTAKSFILLTGWMLTPEIRLRRHGAAGGETVGELLKRKAAAGVRVCVLVWCCVGDADMAETSFKDTAAYFAGSEVHLRLTQGSYAWFSRDVVRSNSFSRHQKVLLCDNGANNVVAFVGGLDLAAGRWDTPAHALFVDPAHAHFAGDVYHGERGKLGEPPAGWPRQPWHDVHARVTGPVTRDLLQLFESRWLHELDLGYASELPPDLGKLSCTADDAAHAHWSLQRLVSYPGTNPQIQNAYCDAIEAAQSLIYIENQYFIGGLEPERDAINDVPRLLAERIAQGIRGTASVVRAAIVVPLQPEGTLDVQRGGYNGKCMGAIVAYQLETIQAMYDTVTRALNDMRRPLAEWTEYLAFFSLARREPAPAAGVPAPAGAGPKGALLARTRRHMIYVHSKFMIVDDRCAIVGSANINERSMSGERDSEVALLCTSARANDTTLRDFRCELLAEHAGEAAAAWAARNPHDTLRELWHRADANWATYVRDDVQALPHNHIVPYPIRAANDGKIQWLGIPDCVEPRLRSSKSVPNWLVN